MTPEERLRTLGLELPDSPVPIGAYALAARAGDLLFLSGTTCYVDGRLLYKGKLGDELSLEEGYAAARQTALNLLAVLRNNLGSLDRVARIVKLNGYVNSAAGFNQQPAVINGASDLLNAVLGDRGQHARTSVGVAELPGDIPVEIEMIVQVASPMDDTQSKAVEGLTGGISRGQHTREGAGMDALFGALAQVGLIPVVRIENPSGAGRLAEALLAGGLPCAEITFRTAGAAQAIRTLARSHPSMLLGAGTVLTIDQAQEAVDAGASFIVSPGVARPVVEWCQKSAVPVMPGVATPTDILLALEYGLSVVKVFPAEALGGVPLLEAMTAPFVGLKLVPTGGITATSLASYLRLPTVLAVGGSWMVSPHLLASDRYDEVTRLTRQAVGIVAQVREGPA